MEEGPGFQVITAIPAEAPDMEWDLQMHIPTEWENHWAEPRLNCQTKEQIEASLKSLSFGVVSYSATDVGRNLIMPSV